MSTLISKILNYEAEIFERYSEARKKLLTFIKTIEINNLPEQKVLIFINDLKQVIDPIITSRENIEYLLSNNMESDESIKNKNEFKKLVGIYLLLDCLRLGGGLSEELSELNSEDSEDSLESELSLDSEESLSESLSEESLEDSEDVSEE
jgi:hypothetical protein